jgi:hypothetical protein
MVGQISQEEALSKLENEKDEHCPDYIMDMFLNNMKNKDEFDQYIDLGSRNLLYQPK